ncbi:MAG: cupredoxin domain-containing protein [Thermoanaerobaculia bacterium]
MKRLVLILTAAALCAGVVEAAAVNGRVSFVTKRGQRPVAAETLVWLEPASADAKLPRRTPATFQMVTRGKMLLPHVLAIPVGSIVKFPNDDPISHNLFSLSPGNTFDLGLYRRGAGKEQKFDDAGVVNVYCNVHPNMSAVIHVMQTPWYVFANQNGDYAFSEIPAGKYRLVAWNEQGGTTQTPVEVNNSGLVSGNLALTLDSRNYHAAQHLDKTGKPYQTSLSKDY